MDKQHWQDWINGFLGLWVLGSPWFFEHTMVTETPGGGLLGMWNLWIVGIAVALIAGIAIFAFQAWEEWTNLILGAWLVISPWALGFSTSAALMWNAVIIGASVVLFAGWALYDVQGPEQPSMK